MEKLGLSLILVLAVLVVVGLVLAGPIPQDPDYHNFADARVIFGIPNFWNVISSVLFLPVGAYGLYQLSLPNKLTIDPANRVVYGTFFAGIVLLALGSAYYHFSPSNLTLVWDRLPISLVLMSLMAIFISEFGSISLAKWLLFPLIVFGLFSVGYWYVSEIGGQGDLRFYAVVQFFPLLIAPVILVCFRSRFTRPGIYWFAIGFFVAAKLFERYDTETYTMLSFISGHSLKHLFAAMGLYVLLRGFQRRQAIA